MLPVRFCAKVLESLYDHTGHMGVDLTLYLVFLTFTGQRWVLVWMGRIKPVKGPEKPGLETRVIERVQMHLSQKPLRLSHHWNGLHLCTSWSCEVTPPVIKWRHGWCTSPELNNFIKQFTLNTQTCGFLKTNKLMTFNTGTVLWSWRYTTLHTWPP